jgi:hypothetical protein
MEIRDGWIYAPDRPGHGLVLSEEARRDWSRPQIVAVKAGAPGKPDGPATLVASRG